VPHASITGVLGVNNVGQVVGTYVSPSGISFGFLQTGGNFITFDAVPEDINDAGQIVGYSFALPGICPFVLPGAPQGFVTTFVGSSPTDPILPNSIEDGVFVFQFPLGGNWYDPPFAGGFTYSLTGGETFSEVGAPPASFGFGPVDVVVGGAILATLNPGEHFLFAPGVTTFSLQGISPLVDTADPTAFPTFLDFTGTPTSLTMAAMVPALNPVAQAGPDQTVDEGTTVTLDGSGSSAPQGLPLHYSWTQVSGLPVTLNLSDPVHPTFVAPPVPIAGETLSFQLTVSNSQLSSTPAVVNVTVKHVNHPPVALVGPDQSVAEASLITLDGSASYDPDAEPVTFLWAQVLGPSVTLSDPQGAQPTFLAPPVGPAGTTLSFQLTVTDTVGSSATAVTSVDVTNVNHPPIANAGSDQTVTTGTQVQLDGSMSRDPDSDPLTFTWSVLSGPPVALSDIHSPKPTFVSPPVTALTPLAF
jgi:REJ domain.